jgi:hypothetical protein
VENVAIKCGLLSFRVARFFFVQYTKAGKNIPNDYKITKCPLNIPNGGKIFKMAECITAFSIPRPSEISTYWYFWSENKTSGNPAFIPQLLSTLRFLDNDRLQRVGVP